MDRDPCGPRTDGGLVVASRGGDRVAFGELVARHEQTVRQVCGRLLGSEDRARDAVQEAAVRALVGLDQLAVPERFGAWLCGIALNVGRTWLRQEARLSMVPLLAISETVTDQEPGPDEQAELTELASRVRRAIAHLAPAQRETVLLFYLQGLTHREVATELGISINAVKARLHQARRALRPQLEALHDPGRNPMTTATNDQVWVEAHIDEIRRDDRQPVAEGTQRPPGGQPHVVVLKPVTGTWELPLWIGLTEALALVHAMESIETPRPMTYQLAVSLVDALGGRLREVRLTSLTAGTFFAQLVLDAGGEELQVDARPSDALNLALITGAPIYVAASLINDAAAFAQHEWRGYTTTTSDIAAEARDNQQRWAAWLQTQNERTE